MMTAEGIGGPKDDVAARALFERAAAQDHPGALERMGAFAQSGRGGPQDTSAAKAYYERAAALGNEDAKAALKRARMPLRDQGQARKLRQQSLFLVPWHNCFDQFLILRSRAQHGVSTDSGTAQTSRPWFETRGHRPRSSL